MVRLLVVAFCLALTSTAQAQTPDILRRLMKEPLTLFDWGLLQLDRDLERAAQRLFPNRPAPETAKTSAIYDWREGQVQLSLALPTPAEQRSQPLCRAIFERLVTEMAGSAPQGARAAGWYLHHAFTPKAHVWTSRFEDRGTKLLEVVRLEVSLRAAPHRALAGDKREVRCTGRLDATLDAIAVELLG